VITNLIPPNRFKPSNIALLSQNGGIISLSEPESRITYTQNAKKAKSDLTNQEKHCITGGHRV